MQYVFHACFKYRLFIILWLTAFMLAGCAPQSRFDATVKPDWVDGVSQKYAGKNYFVGKGQASALDVAANNARAELLNTLPVLSNEKASAILSGLAQQAEVVDVWHDKKLPQHFALVVLEKNALGQLLREQLADLDKKTLQLIATSTDAVSDPLAQIRAIRAALATHQPRAGLSSALQYLGEDGSADDAVWTITEMQVHLRSLLSSIDMTPHVGSDRQLGSAVARGLDAAGYLSKRSQPSYVLKAALERSGIRWKQGWFTEHGILNVELLDQQQQVIGKAQWPLKVKAQERMMLEKELMVEVTNTLREQLVETVLGLAGE